MTMKSYERFLQKNSFDIKYIDSTEKFSDIRSFIENLDSNINSIKIYDPVDNWLSKRIIDTCKLKISMLKFMIILFLLIKMKI